MIQTVLCLMLPFAGNCSDYVREVPKIADVERNRGHYTGRVLSVTGRVRNLDQWVSRSGDDEQVFEVCDGGCIRVYMYAHSPIHNGELVTVRGPYYQTYHAGRNTYHNEIEATEVLPRE